MSDRYLGADIPIGFHAVYESHFDDEFGLATVGDYFVSAEEVWEVCEALAYCRETGLLHPSLLARPAEYAEAQYRYWRGIEDERQAHLSQLRELQGDLRFPPLPDDQLLAVARELDEARQEVRRFSQELNELLEQTALSRNQMKERHADKPSWLTITQLRLESPLDISIAVSGGAGAAVLMYATHLVVRVLKDPERIGGWLPGLVTSWYEGWTKAGQAKLEYQKQRAVLTSASDQVINSRHRLGQLKPVEITTEGAGDPPDDIAHVFMD